MLFFRTVDQRNLFIFFLCRDWLLIFAIFIYNWLTDFAIFFCNKICNFFKPVDEKKEIFFCKKLTWLVNFLNPIDEIRFFFCNLWTYFSIFFYATNGQKLEFFSHKQLTKQVFFFLMNWWQNSHFPPMSTKRILWLIYKICNFFQWLIDKICAINFRNIR